MLIMGSAGAYNLGENYKKLTNNSILVDKA